MDIQQLAKDILLAPFEKPAIEPAPHCEECNDTKWLERKEDSAPVACIFCD
jgi:hypothetical protein